jgi:hypothetical protein
VIHKLGNIPSGTKYFSDNETVYNLVGNTSTYYRAFAKNDNAIGYGDIKIVQTEQPVGTPVVISMGREGTNTLDNSHGGLYITPSLPVNESVTVKMFISHTGVGETTICCRPGSLSTYESVVIYQLVTESSIPKNEYYNMV